MPLTPTPEQEAALSAFRTGADLVLEAGAGTGKTTALKMLSKSTPGKAGIYLAYNRSIAEDAKRSFPPNTQCYTAHSMAFRAVGRRFAHRLNGPRQPAREVARLLRINEPVPVTLLGQKTLVQPRQIARITMDTVGRFCQSADPELSRYHVPKTVGLDDLDTHRAIADVVLPYARKAWEDLSRTDGVVRFTHDVYLKIWAMAGPRLPADFVLLDEAQDANPLVASVIERQSQAQRVLVGDRAQAIYGWNGARDAMSGWTGTRLKLTQSFRFGQAIAGEANKWLQLIGTGLQLRGHTPIASRVEVLEVPDAILCRTNAGAVANAMTLSQAGRRCALVGGGSAIRSMAEASIQLKAGVGTDHPELFPFKTWGEVQQYVEEESSGSDLKVFVKLVDDYGPEAIIAAVDRLVDERYAQVVISTAHKAKGREWATVRIGHDFRSSGRPGTAGEDEGPKLPAVDELMLAYVAVTRARQVLDRDGLAWVDDFGPFELPGLVDAEESTLFA